MLIVTVLLETSSIETTYFLNYIALTIIHIVRACTNKCMKIIWKTESRYGNR